MNTFYRFCVHINVTVLV